MPNFRASALSNRKPSGQLWTPDTGFNTSLIDLHINTAFAVVAALIESEKSDLVMIGDSVHASVRAFHNLGSIL
jgi:hypothetical protein